MHLRLLSSALAAKQLLVPTYSAPIFNATGLVSILSVPSQQPDAVHGRPFTMGHRPVMFTTTSRTQQMDAAYERPFTLGHGPVIFTTASESGQLEAKTKRPFTMEHGPVIVAISRLDPSWSTGHGSAIVPTEQPDAMSQRLVTMGHGPCNVDTASGPLLPLTTSPDLLWTKGHGPVIRPQPTPPAFVRDIADVEAPVSTLATITKGSLTSRGAY